MSKNKFKTKKDKLLSDINVFSKEIEIKCRKVLISKELENKIKNNNDYRIYINVIENDIKTGIDLNKYLSEKIYDGEFNDKFYIATRIKHFHLSLCLKNNSFVKRSDDLLCVFITNTHIYMLDIVPHKDWKKPKTLLDIICRNFPEISRNYLFRFRYDGYSKELNDNELWNLISGIKNKCNYENMNKCKNQCKNKYIDKDGYCICYTSYSPVIKLCDGYNYVLRICTDGSDPRNRFIYDKILNSYDYYINSIVKKICKLQ